VLSHLESSHLSGLGMDVAWMEPFDPDDPILKFPNVIITPHVAGITEYSLRKAAKVRQYDSMNCAASNLLFIRWYVNIALELSSMHGSSIDLNQNCLMHLFCINKNITNQNTF